MKMPPARDALNRLVKLRNFEPLENRSKNSKILLNFQFSGCNISLLQHNTIEEMQPAQDIETKFYCAMVY